jgi:hypothetical protein
MVTRILIPDLPVKERYKIELIIMENYSIPWNTIKSMEIYIM